ncbi:RecX family transcriptional regulator [Candidatus Saccharibacteria bacterium]|nr:RecX family transcriptional regulator [Candidatus Saccharibacteria bacterium]
MEIYKLKDFTVDNVKALIITDLKQGVKNPDRVNVFVNDKFSFSLDVSQVVDFKLKVGKKISEEELNELKSASEFGKLYQRALEWSLTRPRSERELKEYLCKKLRMSSSETLALARRYGERGAPFAPVVAKTSSEDDSELLKNVFNRLVARGYVDDQKFAEWWVENRFVKKGVSQKRLRMELLKKGISKNIIDEVLDARDDEAEIEKIIAKKRMRYADDEKLIQYLCRQGFSFELAREKVQSYGMDSQNLE